MILFKVTDISVINESYFFLVLQLYFQIKMNEIRLNSLQLRISLKVPKDFDKNAFIKETNMTTRMTAISCLNNSCILKIGMKF